MPTPDRVPDSHRELCFTVVEPHGLRHRAPLGERRVHSAVALAVVGLAGCAIAALCRAGLPHALKGLDWDQEVVKLNEFCDTYPYLKFELPDAVLYNNLANRGPESGNGEGIVYKTLDMGAGAGDEYQKEVIMTVNATSSEYHPFSSRMNGMQGKYGSLNLDSGTSVTLSFRFFEEESREKLVIDQYAMTWFDLDTGPKGASTEYVEASGFKEYHLTKETEVKVSKVDGKTKFSASQMGTGEDNPKDPMFLTEQQKNRAVTLLFEKVHAIEITIGAGKGQGPRFFTFVGRPSLLCAVTVQEGFQPPLPDISAEPPLQTAVQGATEERFVKYHVKVGDEVKEGDPVATVKKKDGSTEVLKAPKAGKILAIQDKLAPNDKLDMRLDDKTLAVIEEAYLDPLPLSSTDTQGGPGPDNGVHKLSHFKEYLVEVGDPVTLGDPIATITDSHGHEHKLTATATGAVTARQEDLKKGDPVMKVVDLVLITVGPFPALGPLTKSNVQAGLVEHPEGKTLKEFKVKTGEIVKTGDVIAVVQDSEGNEEEVKASHGGIVTDLQKLPPGTPLTQVEDGNLATTGKFPPLATDSDKDHPVLLSQVNNPPEFEHAASDDQKEKDESSDKAKTPVDLRSLKFVEYKVKVGSKVEDGDPLAVVEDEDGKLHTIVAPAPGTVKRIQEKLQRGHLVGRVLESGDLAVIGPLPTREQGEFTTGVYAPSGGPWIFEEWKADVGENVDRNTTIAILKNEETGELKEVKAAKGGNLAWRRDELQRGDEVESATEDDMLATVGRLPEPSLSFREIGAEAPVDATFDEWKIKEGQRIHFGDPVAQVTLGGRRLVQADGTVRRLAGTTHTIPSPGTGWISYMADLKPGESIKQQSVGPTIAKVYMGVPWWLTLLGSLMALCCCFGCLFKIMKKPKPTYQPMPPVEAEPEPPEPKPETPPPEPEPVPEGLRLDFDDHGTVRTVYCKYRPLGIKHNHKAPIVAHDFTVNSYAKMELGVKDGWKLTRIADEELNDSPNFEEINEKLTGYMKEFPLWPLPLEFLTDAKQPSTAVVKSFLQRPLGLEFSNVAPIQVGKIYEDSPAASMGVVVGWQLTKIGSFDVQENHNFREVMKYFKEGVQPLQDTGKKYGS